MFNKATGNDKESDSARHFAELPITRTAQVVRHDMPQMSDGEIYLRLNVPDGLQNNGEQPQKYITQVVDSHEGYEHSKNQITSRRTCWIHTGDCTGGKATRARRY
jgi:hypothetical protein